MKFLIVVCLISLAVSAYGQDLTCKELEKIGEQGIRKMFIAEEGQTIPATEQELESRCNEGKKLYKSLLEYKKCLKPFPQQIFSTTTQSIGKLLKKNCGDAEGKKTALKLMQCATPEKIRDGQKCAVGAMDVINQMSTSNEGKAVLISKMCCLAHVAADCARQKLGSITCPDPTIKPQEHFEEALSALSKDTMELACENYKSMAACEAKIPDVVNQMKSTLSNANNNLGSRSIIQPLLDIAEKVAN